MKLIILVGAIIGSTIGGFLPVLWGDSGFGGWGVLLSTIGGISGIWAGYKLSKYLEL